MALRIKGKRLKLAHRALRYSPAPGLPSARPLTTPFAAGLSGTIFSLRRAAAPPFPWLSAFTSAPFRMEALLQLLCSSLGILCAFWSPLQFYIYLCRHCTGVCFLLPRASPLGTGTVTFVTHFCVCTTQPGAWCTITAQSIFFLINKQIAPLFIIVKNWRQFIGNKLNKLWFIRVL